jgi:hypothetical protein
MSAWMCPHRMAAHAAANVITIGGGHAAVITQST